jgi:hypothetical protein
MHTHSQLNVCGRKCNIKIWKNIEEILPFTFTVFDYYCKYVSAVQYNDCALLHCHLPYVYIYT